MEKIFYSETIDLSKTRIIEGKPKKRIQGYLLKLSLLQKEINFWFPLLDKHVHPQERDYIKKPICISLYENTYYLTRLRNFISKTAKNINRLFKENKNSSPLNLIDKVVKKELSSIHKYLYDPRRKFAAHNKVDTNNVFLTMGEIISLINRLSDTELISIKD